MLYSPLHGSGGGAFGGLDGIVFFPNFGGEVGQVVGAGVGGGCEHDGFRPLCALNKQTKREGAMLELVSTFGIGPLAAPSRSPGIPNRFRARAKSSITQPLP